MPKQKITKGMSIGGVVRNYPETAEVFFKHGFHCLGCQMAAIETVEQGAIGHGMNSHELGLFVKELNNAAKKSAKP